MGYRGRPGIDITDAYHVDNFTDISSVPDLLSRNEMSISSEEESESEYEYTTTTADSTDDDFSIDCEFDDDVAMAFVLPEELTGVEEDDAEEDASKAICGWEARMLAEMDKLDREVANYSENDAYCCELLLVSTANGFNPQPALLKDPQIWIGDTGASNHSTFCKHGSKNHRESKVATVGITGGDVSSTMMVGIDCVHCDKKGNEHNQRWWMGEHRFGSGGRSCWRQWQ